MDRQGDSRCLRVLAFFSVSPILVLWSNLQMRLSVFCSFWSNSSWLTEGGEDVFSDSAMVFDWEGLPFATSSFMGKGVEDCVHSGGYVGLAEAGAWRTRFSVRALSTGTVAAHVLMR